MATFYDTSNMTRDPLKIVGIVIILGIIIGLIYYTLEPTLETIMAYLEL